MPDRIATDVAQVRSRPTSSGRHSRRAASLDVPVHDHVQGAPVAESIEVFRAAVPPTRLTVEVFPGADHRVQVGEPPRLATGYVERILAFLESHSQS